jgi:exodeoxyribonuclease VII small subunit
VNNENAETYEEMVAKLNAILSRLDNSKTPIDKLAEDVKEGTRLIKELQARLKSVETQVRDAFAELPVSDTEKV